MGAFLEKRKVRALYLMSMVESEHSSLHIRLSDADDEFDRRGDSSTAVESLKPKHKRPSLYKVILHNDDYTPMDFVVELLELFFAMNREKATGVMLKVHREGKAVCGVYTRDIAETKCAQVNQFARENEHPLLCEIEPTEDED